LPIYPAGYAEPDKNPRLPQSKAEIMGGRIALDEQGAEIPASLDDTVIGTETAKDRFTTPVAVNAVNWPFFSAPFLSASIHAPRFHNCRPGR
jgi:hypothetical protein